MRIAVPCCLSMMMGLAAAAAPSGPPERPNIVIILADDLGFSDLGCYGAEIATPNLDRLAAEGMRFTQFYNAARCCPTRASLLTGQYSHRAGVGHMTSNRGLPGYQGFLNDRCITFAEALRPAGYHTWMSGKWHVAGSHPNLPLDRGFERFFGLISGANSYFGAWPGRLMLDEDRPFKPGGEGYYITDAITDRAIAYLKQPRDGRPFLLFVAYTAPHAPLHAWPEDIARYEGKYDGGWDVIRKRRYERLRDLGLIDARWPLSPRHPDAPPWEEAPNKAQWSRKMAVYAAQIDRMDQGIGRILHTLRELGVEQNTLVMFLSDNGGCAEDLDCSPPGVLPGEPEADLGYGLPWANVSNTPFRLFKRGVHEGGIATPFIVRWPAVLKRPGTVTHQVGHVIDVLPTCLEAAGAIYPADHKGKPIAPADGISLVNAFKGERCERPQPLFWEHEGNRAVRSGKWKLVARHLRPWELYDLEADRTELNNLAAQNPDRVNALAAEYDRWAKNVGAVPPEKLPPRIRSRERATGPVSIKPGEPQLFVDDSLIAAHQDLERTLHQPKKDDGGRFPVVPTPAGSETLMAKGSIVYDTRLGKYVMFVKERPSTSLCRLVSSDGLNWSGENGPGPEPVEIDDRHPITRERMPRQYAAMNCIHYDETDPRYPYKGWVYFGNWGLEHEGVYYIRSVDGLKWERLGRVVNGWASHGDLSGLQIEQDTGGGMLYGPGDTTRFAHDPTTGRFLAIFKFFTVDPVGPGNRLRSRAYKFIDALEGPVHENCLERVNLMPPAVQRGAEGPADEYYESTAWRYGSLWLGELLVWHGQDDYPHSAAGCSFVKLVTSHDGLLWNRIGFDNDAGTPEVFMGNGPQGGNSGRNDGGHMSLFSQGPLRIRDELIFYYGASSWGKTAPGKASHGGGIFRARLRPDGFVSVDSGSLTTRPLLFDGRELLVNGVGPIRVEALGENDDPLDTAEITGDSLRHRVSFEGRSLRQIAAGGRVRLRFAVTAPGRLYSFTIN